MESLIKALDGLGFPEPKRTGQLPPDTSMDEILAKITNPHIAIALGASEETVRIIRDTELGANFLDCYAETGQRRFLNAAERKYQMVLRSLNLEARHALKLRASAAITYFHLEMDYAERIRRMDLFLREEVIRYLLSQGSDAPIYAVLLLNDGITIPGLTAGFQARQSLWDLEDSVRDLYQDMKTVGANVLSMSTVSNRRGLREIADALLCSAVCCNFQSRFKWLLKSNMKRQNLH